MRLKSAVKGKSKKCQKRKSVICLNLIGMVRDRII